MAWVRFDDKRALHRKFRRQGFEARGLDEAAITWSGHEETDGFISDEALEDIAHHHGVTSNRAKTLAAQLVSPMERWSRDETRKGWVVRDYLDYNPSRSELEAARKRDRDRKRKRSGGDGDSAGNPDGSEPESEGMR